MACSLVSHLGSACEILLNCMQFSLSQDVYEKFFLIAQSQSQIVYVNLVLRSMVFSVILLLSHKILNPFFLSSPPFLHLLFPFLLLFSCPLSSSPPFIAFLPSSLLPFFLLLSSSPFFPYLFIPPFPFRPLFPSSPILFTHLFASPLFLFSPLLYFLVLCPPHSSFPLLISPALLTLPSINFHWVLKKGVSTLKQFFLKRLCLFLEFSLHCYLLILVL